MVSYIHEKRMVTLRHRPAFGYPVAFLIFGVALLCRFGVDDILPPGFPYVMFIPAVIITAFICGTGPGIFSAVLSFLAAWYFFLPPLYSFELTPTTGVALAFLIFILGVVLVIIHLLMSTSDQLELERANAVRVAGERDNLYREVQHRIGNNLQVVSSLLLFQARSVTDPAAHRALMDSMQRVSVIADIQRKFHDPNRTEGRIDRVFVDELVERCIKAAGLENEIEIVTDINPITLPQGAFLAASLVLTECVTNALEHGHSADQNGMVRVSLHVDPATNLATLSVSDKGPGLPPDFDLSGANSIGLKVIHAFAKQLNGTFTMQEGADTTCLLVFPLLGHD